MKITDNLGLTYDDVLLVPYYSEIIPSEANTESKFSKNIITKIPLASSAMDTVTESATAIAMAQMGGIGVIHKNLSIEQQAIEVEKVKKFESGIVLNPITVSAEMKISELLELKNLHQISGFPVVDKNKNIIGIITNRDVRFVKDQSQTVESLMTKDVVSIQMETTREQAQDLFQKHKVEKLPVLDSKNRVIGLMTVQDIVKSESHPMSCKDEHGRLRTAAAIGVGDKEYERAVALIEKGVDALVVDTAHGHSKAVGEMVERIKKNHRVDVVAGNVATANGCEYLIDKGADAVKIGIGPGSICTTRIISGVGVPQFQALMDCREICLKADVPFIADGGVKYSGDVVKALAAGASTVMIGSLFAGTDESPGEMILYNGRAYKVYRGMGSENAMMKGSKDRYGQGEVKQKSKLVPEGIEGQVPYRGKLKDNVFQLVGGVRSGMGYLGAKDLKTLQENAQFVKITGATQKENHPHDILLIKDAPNYRVNE